MTALLERIGVELPIVQAGMGGGIASGQLAAAVSEAGGLGTIGILDPPALAKELARARRLTDKPLAVNILLPFARDGHWPVADQADAVVTFWGTPKRRVDTVWLHQCGSVKEAIAAHKAGADGVIVQGVEAGGHVRGETPALELLAEVKAMLPAFPVFLAGGIAERRDVEQALDRGADAVVAGTRFLLSDESAAHREYKRRLLDADETVLTELFGFGWPARHRVIPNAATERWLSRARRTPVALRAFNRALAPAASRMPLAVGDRLLGSQRPGLPLFGPSPPRADSPPRSLDSSPLYAGETVRRISAVRPARELVAELAGRGSS